MASFQEAGLRFSGRRVLEVGCYDGSILSSTSGRLRVGVDVALATRPGDLAVVRADGNHLPFRSGSFDQVIAAEVLEHVPNASDFIQELQRATATGGEMFLSTPSVHLRLFPPFVTGYVSRRWGHFFRRGYSAAELRALAGPSADIREWSAPACRLTYLPLRLLASFHPRAAGRLINWAARYDARHTAGCSGFYWLFWHKQSDAESGV